MIFTPSIDKVYFEKYLKLEDNAANGSYIVYSIGFDINIIYYRIFLLNVIIYFPKLKLQDKLFV